MKKIIRYLLILFLVAVIVYCALNIFNIENDYKKASSEYDNLSSLYTTEKDTNSETNISEIPGNTEINTEDKSSQENDLPNYKKIDFNSLVSINSDIIGWIIIPGTIVDYPIVYSHDNNEYLKLTFQKEYSSSGSIFMDTRNKTDFSDYNSIIYGHNMKNGSMFRVLRNYMDENFYKEHRYIQIYTPNKNYTYKIISCYETIKTSEAYTINFNNQDEYSNWLETISKNSQYYTNEYNNDKSTITLSTCAGGHGGDERFVVHLQLVN